MAENRNYTYILRCSDGTYYTGWTNDIEKRLKAHNSGKGCKYTRTRCPVALVYLEESETKEAAMSREWHIKRLTREEKEKLIESCGLPDMTYLKGSGETPA
ncbi:MAG: GIY-YIG nuclease family protein [Lachnospiraceae bacterium]|nr:GIY-YIG nuclease family protein [Lachnospiraceae bacterium]